MTNKDTLRDIVDPAVYCKITENLMEARLIAQDANDETLIYLLEMAIQHSHESPLTRLCLVRSNAHRETDFK